MTDEVTTPPPEREARHRLVLLRLRAGDRCVNFILRQPKYDHHDSPDHGLDNDRYFYEQHSCPTNWFSDIVAVIENGDADPHGFLEFVAARNIPEGFDPDNPEGGSRGMVENDIAQAWERIFPELTDSDGLIIDGEGVEVLSLPYPMERE